MQRSIRLWTTQPLGLSLVNVVPS